MEKNTKVSAENQTQRKFTYEELENVCHQLSEQSRALYQKLQENDMTNLFKRLDYLFAVIENINVFPSDFAKKCVNEIVESMTLPEKDTKEK